MLSPLVDTTINQLIHQLKAIINQQLQYTTQNLNLCTIQNQSIIQNLSQYITLNQATHQKTTIMLTTRKILTSILSLSAGSLALEFLQVVIDITTKIFQNQQERIILSDFPLILIGLLSQQKKSTIIMNHHTHQRKSITHTTQSLLTMPLMSPLMKFLNQHIHRRKNTTTTTKNITITTNLTMRWNMKSLTKMISSRRWRLS